MAFSARIDKSKSNLILKSMHRAEHKSDKSPYFSINSQPGSTNKTECSLLPREAKIYGYKLTQSPSQSATIDELYKNRDHKCISKLLLFKPRLMTAGLSTAPIGQSTLRIEKYAGHSMKKKASRSLREQLNRGILKTTRVAMSNACKQYPRLSSQSVLDKYAHLFGLQPVVIEKTKLLRPGKTGVG